MGRHSVPPFNMGDHSLLTNLLNNPKVSKVITYAETASPGFVGAVSAADKLRLIEDQDMDASGANAMNNNATAVGIIHVDLGAEYAISHIRWGTIMTVDGSGSFTCSAQVSSDNFSADTETLDNSIDRTGISDDHIWQVMRNMRYFRLYIKPAMDGTRELAWRPLQIYGNALQL